MKLLLRQLFAPLRYLKVRGDSKRSVDIGLPSVLAAISTLGLVSSGAPILASPGLVGLINELLQVLVGFYVAALAAVSVLGRASLDQLVNNTKLDGKGITRRQFLAYLFGYLALLSLGLYCVGAAGVIFSHALPAILHSLWAKSLVLFIYMTAWWNMVAVTLLGLHYLVDRAFRADPVITEQPGKKSD